MEMPDSEFIDIPPDGASFVTAYTTGRGRVPRLIDLAAIDHIEFLTP
jgi:hypothetical protein